MFASTSLNLPNELPISGIKFPTNPLMSSALAYTQKHTSPTTVSHCLRSAAFALIGLKKNPAFATADQDLVVLTCLLHDLGWATTPSLVSKDKRFEVDGADLARSWLRENLPKDSTWGHRDEQLLWDAIALHTTPSIAFHKEAEVGAVCLGISADFFGYKLPGGLISVEEHQEIVATFPRMGFHDEVVNILCGFCREKPETTYDNFVAVVGSVFGLDGKGGDAGGFEKRAKEHNGVVMTVLKANEEEEKAWIRGDDR